MKSRRRSKWSSIAAVLIVSGLATTPSVMTWLNSEPIQVKIQKARIAGHIPSPTSAPAVVAPPAEPAPATAPLVGSNFTGKPAAAAG